MRPIQVKQTVLEVLGQIQEASPSSEGAVDHGSTLEVLDVLSAAAERLHGAPPADPVERALLIDARYAFLRLRLAVEEAVLNDQVLDEEGGKRVALELAAVGARAADLPDRRVPMDTIRRRAR
jgi:hypothetical protein